jgi:glycosidase
MRFRRQYFLFLLIFVSTTLFGQASAIQHLEPPFWWIGMHNPNLQLLVHADNISTCKPSINYPGVIIKEIWTTDNPNYLFIDLDISAASAGTFIIKFECHDKRAFEYEYRLLPRTKSSASRKGFDQSDLIYLVLPDRFVNGDPKNDTQPDMLEAADRSNPDGRHGGDLQGVMQKLDYIDSLGATALWLNPVFENNMPAYSYHGYSITDYYQTDPRLGTNEDFRRLNEMLHQRGMKAVMDMIFNHCGLNHWWMKDLPANDWVHQFAEFTKSNFRASTVFDPYVSKYDETIFSKGWFDTSMPDLNQKNPFLMTYLTQNSIWWIEYAGLDGIRMDTYPYPYKEQMAQWAGRVLEEYPDFSIVGEVWVGVPALLAPWEKDPAVETGYKSHLPYIFDFAMYDAFGLAFTETSGWSTGITRMYDVLAQDFVYGENPRVVIFPDNHDGSRLFTKVGHSLANQKLAVAFALTTRGVPQLYYGTEILMSGNEGDGHGKMRKDFPGGWQTDSANKFIASGRTGDEEDMLRFTQKLANYRKNHDVLQTGKLTHFIPQDNVYVYFRHNDDELIMIVINNSNENRPLDLKRYDEMTQGISTGINILDGSTVELKNLIIPAKEALVIKLR